jgi:hypothetical protein
MIGNGGGGGGSVSVNPADAVYQLLSTVGDGTGTTSMNVDGTTPVKFFIQPPANEKYTLQRMNVEAIDGNFNNAALYGTVTLTIGMRIYVENDGGIIKEYTDGFTIKRNHDWALLSGVDAPAIGGAGSDALLVRWTFKNGCTNITLDGSNNERLVVEVADDMTGLDDQLIQVQGCRKAIA